MGTLPAWRRSYCRSKSCTGPAHAQEPDAEANPSSGLDESVPTGLRPSPTPETGSMSSAAAERSVSQWCHEPASQLDPGSRESPGLSPRVGCLTPEHAF